MDISIYIWNILSMSCKYSGTVASDNCISSMTWSMSFFLLLIPKNSYLKVISSGEQVPTLVSSVDCPLLGKLLHVVQDFRSGVFPGQPSLCCHPHSYLPQIMWAPNCKIPLWIQVPRKVQTHKMIHLLNEWILWIKHYRVCRYFFKAIFS